MKPALVVLAAGLSRRYGRLKQTEPVGPAGEAMLDFGLYDALAAGFGEVVVVVRSEIEAPLREHFDRVWPGLAVRFVHQVLESGSGGLIERSRPWGTGHAVLAAAGVLDGPFAVMNADDFYGRRAFERLSGALTDAEGADFWVVAWELSKTLSPFGGVSRALLVADRGGVVEQVTELVNVRDLKDRIEGRALDGAVRELTGRERISMNLWGFTPALFPLLREAFRAFAEAHSEDPEAEFPLSDAVNDLIARGQASLRLLPTDEEWMGVTWSEDRPRVAHRLAELVAAGRYPAPLSQR